MDLQKASDFDPEALQLYDEYVHGRISRRELSQRIAAFAVAGITAESLINALTSKYAWAQQINPKDMRIKTGSYTYESANGAGKVTGLLARPATAPSLPSTNENSSLDQGAISQPSVLSTLNLFRARLNS